MCDTIEKTMYLHIIELIYLKKFLIHCQYICIEIELERILLFRD